MPPPPAKKRRLVAPAAVATRRATRSQKPRLNAELLGKVATYSSLGRDLLNLCVVAGPRDCAVIRHAYLRNNLRYLEESLYKCFNFGTDKEDAGQRWPWLDHGLCGDRYLAWMEVNTDWRRLITAERIDSLATAHERDNEGIFTAIVNHLLPFNNPAVAIELGLMDPMRHLVEEMGIDVNSYKWIAFKYDPYKISRQPRNLLAQCADSDNFSAFQYLLGRDAIDVCSKVSKGGDHEALTHLTVLEECFCSPNRTAFFRELLLHPACSLDISPCFASTIDADVKSMTAHAAIGGVEFLIRVNLFHSWTWNDNFRLLLEAGVDMDARDQFGRDGVQYAKDKLADAKAGSLLQNVLKDALQILEDWVATK